MPTPASLPGCCHLKLLLLIVSCVNAYLFAVLAGGGVWIDVVHFVEASYNVGLDFSMDAWMGGWVGGSSLQF